MRLAGVLVALNVWWMSNTVAHQFIHRPFFRRRSANLCFGAALSVLLGIPQALWRDRHLAHHAGVAATVRPSAELALQTAMILGFWTLLAIGTPAFLMTAYAPGYLIGLLVCALHGHYEHAHGTTSHYGALYNALCLNDGYHVEHHRYPGVHWRKLPQYRLSTAPESRWPAPLRWLEHANLEGLERLVFRSRALQAFVLRTHRRALEALLAKIPTPSRVAIVGGGLFPRTALIMRRLLPRAELTIIDVSGPNLECARQFLGNDAVRFIQRRYEGGNETAFDLLVFPLAFDGDRHAVYAAPPAAAVLVHDWIWRPKGTSRVVSIALMKRLNLLRRER